MGVQAMVRAAKLAVYCIVEVEGQQRRTVPVAGASGEFRKCPSCPLHVSLCPELPHTTFPVAVLVCCSESPMLIADVLWNEELTFKTVRSTADLRVSVFARMRLGSDAFLGERNAHCS